MKIIEKRIEKYQKELSKYEEGSRLDEVYSIKKAALVFCIQEMKSLLSELGEI